MKFTELKTPCYVIDEQKLIKNLEKSYNKRYQTSLMTNSEFVRQHGLERFMEQQKEKYTCSKCGGIISIHDRECSECQESMK
jgi:ribosomal protein S27AE